ncbi:NAD(P)/FAD-dependent oxidoreductase [Beijerinckia mobilis]|uniref:NAD(P)/FAD-dependent oxidoreductase n=1 Tax=Beijerinckia mobilis TaxID=231434 RepID=UPI000558A447|nr:FAD-dependent oxidoreductase [Beijerinckia mobilis]
MTVERIVIIGAGEAGCRAAFALRENSFTGEIVLLGDEPLSPYERPPLSKQCLQTKEPARYIAQAEQFSAQAITFRAACPVEAIQPQSHIVRLGAGEEIRYDRLLLATGARARPLRIKGADAASLFYLRTHADALRLGGVLDTGRRIAIVGGGFIGLELAALARTAGAEVILFEAATRLLSRGASAELSDRVAALHLRAGVDLRLGAQIAGIAQTGQAHTILLSDGEQFACDAILVGVGAEPETKLAAAAGITLDNGIAVDSQLRTSTPDIFAAGDCCSFPHLLYGQRRIRLEAWRNAQDQANLAARNILGASESYTAVPWLWSDQYDITLQIAGLIDEGTTLVTRNLADGGAQLHFHLNDEGRLVAAAGIGTTGLIARDIRLAEMLIAQRARPAIAALAQPDVKLKTLLAA